MSKKKWLMIALSLYGFAVGAEAGSCNQQSCSSDCPPACSPCDNPAPTPCQRVEPVCVPKPAAPRKCPPKPCCTPPAPCYWKFNPCNPKGCTAMNCGGGFVSADFLYWRSENHGFSYAYALSSSSPKVGSVVRIDPSWAPAFRVGAGWNIPYDFWDLFLNYTWYQNHSSQTQTNTLGFIPLWPVSSSAAGLYGQVSASARCVLDMGDLEMGRLIFLSKTVAIRPYCGLRGGILHQKFKDEFSSLMGSATAKEKFQGSNRYWGIGPRTGLNGEWHIGQGFSFLGKAAGALLYGHTDTQNSHYTESANVFSLDAKTSDDFDQLVPNLQFSFGMQWQSCFWCEKMFFKMSASWEASYWWDQFNIPYTLSSYTAPMPTVGSQPLTMEGLTVNFEWDF